MVAFAAQDPHFEARVRTSFDRQNLNRTIGARLGRVAPGEVEIELPFREALGQQHGFIHGGIVASIVDTACGYAALTLAPADAEVLTVEFKINFIAPAEGERLFARGRVAKPGRTLSICAGDVVAVK
ncbi:MAG: thioesterase, partial [Candidatus Rokubacteria bacterium 13_1_40CM_69_27]